jgi:hypothetical protein
MTKKFVFAFATLALAVASAANHYTVDLSVPSEINGQILQPGAYKMELTGNHVVLKSGKTVVEAEARVENQDKKFFDTSIRYAPGTSNSKIEEIRIGGTTIKVVFTKTQASGN